MTARISGTFVLAGALLLSACSNQAADDGGGQERITHRAVAAVALEHLPTDTSSRVASYTDESTPTDQVSVDLRYGADGEYDGDLITVVVSAGPAEVADCSEELGEHCTELSTEVKGATAQLHWTDEEPEEDPGTVEVVLQREGGETALVGYSGPSITDDPRELDLPINVEELTDVVEDPRLRYRASASTRALGEDLEGWEGGEPDPAAYDRVRNTDHGIAQAYVGGRGGYGQYEGIVRSPLREQFGAGAIGGRVLQRTSPDVTDIPDADIDVLAAPSPPDWMTDDPCSARRLRSHCVSEEGERGPLVFAWQPDREADPGWVWMISLRESEVVAIRYQGPRIPASYDEAAYLTEWYDGEQLDSDGGEEADSEFADDLSMWCDREHLDARPVEQLD